MSNLNLLLPFLKSWLTFLKPLISNKRRNENYRILKVFQNKKDEYIAHIQIVSKSLAFYIRPEEILANDNFVEQFSARDVRTLTYLGYLGINNPRFKIMAQKLAMDNTIIFMLKKKGDINLTIKTATEIFQEPEIISNLPPSDACTIGYAVAEESFQMNKRSCLELRQKITG